MTAIRGRKAQAPPGPDDRLTWTMPPIESLRPPTRSPWRTLGLVVLRCYLIAAVIVLAVRAIQIALGTGLPFLRPRDHHGDSTRRGCLPSTYPTNGG